MVNILSRKTHGILDYVGGALLIASPWLFGFYNGALQSILPVAIGLFIIGYSLLSKYEYGLVKLLPFTVHLFLDTVTGTFLAASPWIFNFSETIYVPHLVLGLMVVVSVLLTDERLINFRGHTAKAKKPRKTQLLYTPWKE